MKSHEVSLNTSVWCTAFELSRNCGAIIRNLPPLLGHFEGETYSGCKYNFVPENSTHKIARWSFGDYYYFLTYEEAAEYYNKCLANAQKDITHEMAATIGKLEKMSERINSMYVINNMDGAV
nr:MAG TPA: hypothetical protein [Caudoviricetes sp.]